MLAHLPAAAAGEALPPSTADMGPWMQPGKPKTLSPKPQALNPKPLALTPNPCSLLPGHPMDISPAWTLGLAMPQLARKPGGDSAPAGSHAAQPTLRDGPVALPQGLAWRPGGAVPPAAVPGRADAAAPLHILPGIRTGSFRRCPGPGERPPHVKARACRPSSSRV